MNNRASFFRELKRRNVYKVAVAYAVVGWLVVQVAATIVPALHLPESLTTAVVVITLLGFPIAVTIAWAFEMTPEGMKRTENIAPDEHLPQWSRRKFFAFIGVVALLAAALLVWERLELTNSSPGTAATKSIAVLPFENLSRDPDNAFFADGIQDEILTRLAKIGELKVISRTSTQRYKSTPEDLPRIAQQLGVAHVLEGSVQKSGGQVRVTVQLIQAATDSHLWAETYDRKLTDIFVVESEVAEKIARSLRARFTGAEQAALSARPTENAEAYEAYLRGLALWNSLTTSPRVMEKNVLYFNRAVQLDPNFGLAWASLSTVHSFIYAEYERTPQRLALARETLDKAMSLDPNSGETQFALGLFRYRGLNDYDGALSAFQKARARAANRVEAIEFSAYVKRRQGRWDDALALHAESLRIDPRNPILLSESALTYRALRRFHQARELIDRALEIEPSSFTLVLQKAETHLAEGDLAMAHTLLAPLPVDGQDLNLLAVRLQLWICERKYDEAIATFRKLLANPENLPPTFGSIYRVWLGIAEALAGEAEPARADLSRGHEELARTRAQGDTSPRIACDLIFSAGFLHDKGAVDREAAAVAKVMENDAMEGPGIEQALAVARAQLGERDAALKHVSHVLQIYGEGSLTRALLRLDPLWDPLRSDPRFRKLVQP